MLLVVEVKTMVADIQDLLGTLDMKLRLGPRLAAQRGWQPAGVRPILLFLDGATTRRRIREHDNLFRGFALRGAEARRWLRHPKDAGGREAPGLLLFQSLPKEKLVGRRNAGRQRVRAIRAQVDRCSPDATAKMRASANPSGS
jgi:hypothetical protein